MVYLVDATIETTPFSGVNDQERQVDRTFCGRSGGKDILALTGKAYAVTTLCLSAGHGSYRRRR
jgi:hypothetical protein